MSETTFDIAFYGIIQPGKDKATVIENMARLFKTTPEKIAPFFAGSRKVIKANVDTQTAEKYRNALENVGLVIKLEPRQSAARQEAESAAQAGTEDITVAPVGADVLENPTRVEPQAIGDISTITMAEVGADVLENPPRVEPQPIGDISHLTMAEVGADVLENPPTVEPQPIDDISGITMAEAGADIIERSKPGPGAPLPDTSDITIKGEQ